MRALRTTSSRIRTAPYLCLAGYLAVLSLPACSGESVDTCNPPMGDFGVYGFQPDAASVAWAIDSFPLHSAAVVPTSPAVGDCQLRVMSGKLASPASSTLCARDRNASVFLDCAVTESRPTPPATVDMSSLWSTEISGLGDVRTWPTGEVALADPYRQERYPTYLRDSAGCQTTATIGGAATGIRVVLEEATGGIADFPLLVTPDYRRVFRIELYVAQTLADQIAGTCGVVATMTVSLRFIQTPADFAIRHESCAYCG